MEDRPMNQPTKAQRILGGLYGSLVGDALGVPVEFCNRFARVADPVIGMRGHGTHNQPAGTWSDDGSLLLCAVESLTENGFNTQDMGERFVRWFDDAHWSAHGEVFDIGNTTSKAIHGIAQGTLAEEAGGQSLYDNGNGSLMRILPVVLATLNDEETAFCDQLERASAITHGHERSKLACAFFGLYVRALMLGSQPTDALQAAREAFVRPYQHLDLMAFQNVLSADLANWKIDDVTSGGYVMETLTASIWCLLTTDNFSDCVLKAVNLGGDTDTTGCVAGGLAGVYYGQQAIPQEWIGALPKQAELQELFAKFVSCQ
jgi:ADP-ribosyl-[dinitrogen reductase] hydrolase